MFDSSARNFGATAIPADIEMGLDLTVCNPSPATRQLRDTEHLSAILYARRGAVNLATLREIMGADRQCAVEVPKGSIRNFSRPSPPPISPVPGYADGAAVSFSRAGTWAPCDGPGLNRDSPMEYSCTATIWGTVRARH